MVAFSTMGVPPFVPYMRLWCHGFMRQTTLFLMLGGAGMAAGGCTPSDPVAAAAGTFVDHYYVQLDLAGARPFATGLALAKLDHEQELLAGIAAAQASGKPSVHYSMVEEGATNNGQQRSFLYELTITFADAQVTRLALVTMHRDSAQNWRVANFEELR